MRLIDGKRMLLLLGRTFCAVVAIGLAGCKPKMPSAAERTGLKFCEHQSQTNRGTAPYVVVCGQTPKIECLKIVAGCGARVIGSVSADELLIETSVYALAKIYTNACFVSVREWLPQDKIDKGFAAGEATVTVLTAEDRERLAMFLKERKVNVLEDPEGGRTAFRVKLPATLVKELAAKGEVRRIAP